MTEMMHRNRYPLIDNRRCRTNCLLLFCTLLVVAACSDQVQSPFDAEQSNNNKALGHRIIDAAIEAHGGFDELKAASMWVGEIRRHQRGNSYVMTNYYRPGMVRLEQGLGNGEKSADVIGDAHCWGARGPVSVPCSRETRANDLPRVIMEMAVQLWPLKEEDWEVLAASSTDDADLVTARFIPRDSIAEFTFDKSTHMLGSISIEGIKEGVSGTHLHVYSDYREFCGVRMPAHNVKSFEGEVWVAEDVLSIECKPVLEEFFVRPVQVEDGAFLSGHLEESIVACLKYDSTASGPAELEAALVDGIESNQLVITGGPQRHLINEGDIQLCMPVERDDAGEDTDLIVRSVPASEALSVFSLHAFDPGSLILVEKLLSEVEDRNLTPGGPVRVHQYDNDGMGMTGEVVVEMQVPVKSHK